MDRQLAVDLLTISDPDRDCVSDCRSGNRRPLGRVDKRRVDES